MTERAKNDVLEALRQSLRKRMNEVADHLAAGPIEGSEESGDVVGRTYGEVKRLRGVIEGLAHAERDLLDLDEKMGQQG